MEPTAGAASFLHHLEGLAVSQAGLKGRCHSPTQTSSSQGLSRRLPKAGDKQKLNFHSLSSCSAHHKGLQAARMASESYFQEIGTKS